MTIQEVKEEYSSIVTKFKQELTVFMTAHNREEYIGEAIKAVIRNNYRNYCLIVLDNDSTDRTAQVVAEYVKNYNNVFYIYHKYHPNFEYALLNFCLTKYIIVLHDDDIVEPNYIETVLSKIKTTKCVALSTSAWIINQFSKRVDFPTNTRIEDSFFVNDEYFHHFFTIKSGTMCFPSTIYDRDFYVNNPQCVNIEVGPCSDDYLFFQSERYGGKIGKLKDRLINYRIHDKQASNVKRDYMYVQLLDFLIENPYYKSLLEKHKNSVIFFIWKTFKFSFLDYNETKISKDDYVQILNRISLKFILSSVEGKILWIKMKFIILFNKPIYKLYKLKKLLLTKK